MADEESLTERQEDELEVLKAIYVNDVKDLRDGDAWKIRRPPEVQITLRPQESTHGKDVYAMVDMHVKCPPGYPNQLPEIKFENYKGISNQQIAALTTEVKDLAKQRIGEVMVLELCQHVQHFLHQHNKPPAMSFYEEMMSNKRRQEEQEAHEHLRKMEQLRRKEEKEMKEIEDEILRRQEAAKEEGKRRREEARRLGIERASGSEPSTPGSDQLIAVTPILPDTCQKARQTASPEFKTPAAPEPSGRSERKRKTSTPKPRDDSENRAHTSPTVLAFNTKAERMVHRGKCLGTPYQGCRSFAGMDTKTGELVSISEWVLKWRHVHRKLNLDGKDADDRDATKYIKQICIIEQEVLTLIKLHHDNLVHYFAINYHQEPGRVTVQILMEYMSGSSLDIYLRKKLRLATEELRFFTSELLQALAYLHNKAIVHKDLKASCVFLDHDRHIRLADYSIVKRLQDLYVMAESQRQNDNSMSGATYPPLLGRGGQKGDIYQLGIMILSLALGKQVTEVMPDVPNTLPEELQDFLSKCLLSDERKRYSAHQLLDHSFIKTPIPHPVSYALSHKPTGHKTGHKDKEDKDETEEIPFIPSVDTAGHSRLYNEFAVLSVLGKGGFGDVIKVKNKLDGRYYAIKRIPLNPRSKQFNRKITREVKLLSRLNHENVVRYYNSWIETTEEPAMSDSSSSAATATPRTSPSKTSSPDKQTKADRETTEHMNGTRTGLGFADDIEKFAPPQIDGSVDWSVSLDQGAEEPDSSSEEEDEIEDVFGTSFLVHSSSSESVVFEQDEENSTLSAKNLLEKSKRNDEEENIEEDPLPRLQFLYIQMEFCERSTLRNCIDMGLYEDTDRVWRLFREIVEGLVHIHEQGIIHRDLKPPNIFLDSNDHVKIGDFGLATTNLLNKQHGSILEMSMNPSLLDLKVTSSKSDSSLADLGALTGKVGTALYVSPEVMGSGVKAHYSQRVDIYSLGIIFFEMCYKPMTTGMERVGILGKLRLPSIDLPPFFDSEEYSKQVHVIRWLLNHDPAKRPTSMELLQSEYIPPVHMEEAALYDILRSTVTDNRSRAYKHLMTTIFSQQVPLSSDVSYDFELRKVAPSEAQLLEHQAVRDILERVFRKHGAVSLSTPLLMPKSELYQHQEQYISLMDQQGGLVALPYDLRVPFARYIANSGLSNLKSYNIDRVYCDKRYTSAHPRVIVECAFDIVTPNTASLVPDAELIHIVHELISEFTVLQSRNYTLLMNHSCLLKAVLLHCGIEEEKHLQVCQLLDERNFKNEKERKTYIQEKLQVIGLPENVVVKLYTFMTKEEPFGKMASWLRCITKTSGQAASLAKKGLHEMEIIINQAETLGCHFQPVLTLRPLYNWRIFSGIMFQIYCEIKKKKRLVMDILAAGGRYDNLVEQYHMPLIFRKALTTPPSAAGVSIAFEKLVTAYQAEQHTTPTAYDVLVCSLGHKPLMKEKLSVIRDLWAAGLATTIFHSSTQDLEDIQDQCRNAGIKHLVVLKDHDCKVRSFEKDRFVEKKMSSAEVADHLLQKMHSARQESPETSAGSSSKSSMQSQSSVESVPSSSSNQQAFNITVLQPEGSKMSSNTKRRYESQVYSGVASVMTNLCNKVPVEILAVDLDVQVLKTVAAFLEVNGTEKDFQGSIAEIIKKHQRHRPYLTRVIDHIYSLKFTRTNSPIIVLYGLRDDSHRVLL